MSYWALSDYWAPSIELPSDRTVEARPDTRKMEKPIRQGMETAGLQTAKKQEHHQDDYHEAQAAAWVVAPAPTVWPSGQTA